MTSAPPDALGPYLITGELGRGAQGIVYRARHRDLPRDFAVKTLLDARPGSPAARRLAREAAALGRLRHGNVVEVFAVLTDAGRVSVVMSLIEGESLEERIERTGPLPPRRAAAVARSLAAALDHAHRAGILHRDVKPSNVLLRARDGEAFLTDFGLARIQDPSASGSGSDRPGRFLGTPGYTPPEQALAGPAEVGPPADVFGLGATLFAMLTGRPPFATGSFPELIASMDRPVVVPPDLEPALARIVRRCLAAEPSARYGSAREVERALGVWLDGAPRPRRLPRTAVIGSVAGAIGGGALVLAVAGLGLAVRSTPAAPVASSPSPPAAADPAAVEAALGRAARLAGEGRVDGWAAALDAAREAAASDPELRGRVAQAAARDARDLRARLEALLEGTEPYRPEVHAAARRLEAAFVSDPPAWRALRRRRLEYLRRRRRGEEALGLAEALADTDDATGRFARLVAATLRAEAGDPAGADAELLTLAAAAPGTPAAACARAHAALTGDGPPDPRALDAALAAVEEALARDPDDIEAIVLEALVRLARGERDRAALLAADALRRAPDEPRALLVAATCAAAAGRTGAARRRLELAVDLTEGRFVPALELLCALLVESGREREARALLEAHLTEGTPPRLRLRRALLHRRAGDLVRARRDALAARAVAGADAFTALVAGLAPGDRAWAAGAVGGGAGGPARPRGPLAELPLPGSAGAELEAALTARTARLRPPSRGPVRAAVRAAAAGAPWTELGPRVERALAAAADDASALAELAWLLAGRGRHEEAREALAAARALRPPGLLERRLWGEVHWRQGRRGAALGLLDSVAAADPGGVEGRCAAATAHLIRQEPAAARAAAAAALALEPDHVSSLLAAGLARQALGEEAGAAAIARRVHRRVGWLDRRLEALVLAQGGDVGSASGFPLLLAVELALALPSPEHLRWVGRVLADLGAPLAARADAAWLRGRHALRAGGDAGDVLAAWRAARAADAELPLPAADVRAFRARFGQAPELRSRR